MESPENSPNAKLIEHLANIVHYYNLQRETGFQYRVKNYTKVIQAVQEMKFAVISAVEAKKIPGCGDKISLEIEEFAVTGTTQKFEDLQAVSKDTEQYITLFTGVHGIGVVSAHKFYKQGYRSLKDLKKAKLTTAQKIGLKYYKQIHERIPRQEITDTYKVIKRLLSPYKCVCKISGSYRRREETSGDIDLLVTGSRITMGDIISSLSPIILETLAYGPLKFMGITTKFRRLDIRLFKKREYPCALMYFTGSMQFNVFMRTKAISLGYTLNEYGLFNIENGEQLKTKCEKDIFDHLSEDFVKPVCRTKTFGA